MGLASFLAGSVQRAQEMKHRCVNSRVHGRSASDIPAPELLDLSSYIRDSEKLQLKLRKIFDEVIRRVWSSMIRVLTFHRFQRILLAYRPIVKDRRKSQRRNP